MKLRSLAHPARLVVFLLAFFHGSTGLSRAPMRRDQVTSDGWRQPSLVITG